MAMLQLDTRAIFALGDEAHLHFRLQIRVVLPIGVDLPRKQEPGVRFPREHPTPVTSAPVVTALVPAAAHAGLDHGVHRLRLADLVGGEWPPGAHLLGEHAPRHLPGRLHTHDLAEAVRLVTYRLLVHDDFLSCFLVSRSAASLNAASALPQNTSSHLRSASRPCASTALRTFRCCETAGRLTSIPSAISPTEREPPRRRLNTSRRVGSPSASRTRS